VKRDGAILFQYRDGGHVVKSKMLSNALFLGMLSDLKRDSNRISAWYSGADYVSLELDSRTLFAAPALAHSSNNSNHSFFYAFQQLRRP
jgi:hypothetical protein